MILLISIKCNNITEGFKFSNKEDAYNYISDKGIYQGIVKGANRNAAGFAFYYWISNKKHELTKEEFINFNQLYCSVSGSLISYKRTPNPIIMEHINGKLMIGDYYNCCVPCLCDLMRYAKIEESTIKLKDGEYNHYVITIKNWDCSNKLPDGMDKKWCNELKDHKVLSKSGRLIIGVLHNVRELNDKEYEEYNNSKISSDNNIFSIDVLPKA